MNRFMQEKHKVTLYLPPEVHRQLKIRSAVESEAMSAIAERAIVFYLTHSDVVDEVEMSHGHTHQIHSCPSCTTALVWRDGEFAALGEQPGLIADEEISELSVGKVQRSQSNPDQSGEQELVPC